MVNCLGGKRGTTRDAKLFFRYGKQDKKKDFLIKLKDVLNKK